MAAIYRNFGQSVVSQIICKKQCVYSISRSFSGSCVTMTNDKKVGFIGIGNMGAQMARNLLKKGYSLIVYDVYPEAINFLKDHGANSAHSPSEVAEKAQQIITMLPSTPHVQEVLTGENGIFRKLQKGSLIIDSSTIDPGITKQLAARANELGAMYVDSPVSGGVNAAKEASLTFMVGGTEEAFNSSKPLLECMGKNVVHCGDIGSGQAAKICNNMLLGISMLGVAETMNLGLRLGLDAKLLAKVLNSSSGRCWSSEIYNPVPGVIDSVPASKNYEGGFGTTLMAKDLGLAQNAASATLSPTPLGSLAHQFYRVMVNKGFGNKDFSSVFLFLQDQNLRKK